MSEAIAHVAPFHDPSRKRRLVKVAGWIIGTVVVVFILDFLGVDVIGWLQDLWDQIKEIPVGYIVAALVFQTGQTLLAGLSYYGILRAAYPGQVEFWPIVTAYAVGVAMNNFLPANIGTFATLIMTSRKSASFEPWKRTTRAASTPASLAIPRIVARS